MTTALGGPGVACSLARIRRLEAGELAGDERARTEAHLAGCARCQGSARELEREREALEASLPFDRFAAGVAEGLARAEAPPARRRFLRAGMALAALLLAAAALPLLSQLAPRPDEEGWRAKGARELTVWASEGGRVRALREDEPVPPGASLRVGFPAAGRAHGAVALVDADGVAILFAGAAAKGAVGEAFTWTGTGDGWLVAVLDEEPVDAGALRARLERGGVAAVHGAGAEVLVRKLTRGGP